MKKQSSIEWLVEQLDLDIDSIWAIKEAKQMHKQEIVEAYEKISMDTPEEFYKNTYETNT